MKTKLVILFLLLAKISLSQNPGMKELREKNIGWEKMMPPKGNVGTSKIIEGRTFSSYQLGLIDVFSDWIKASYIPIGGLPQFEKYVAPKKDEYLPVGSGVFLWAWDPAYDESGKNIVKSQPASATIFGINTNFLPGKESAVWFNTSTAHYFTLPFADYMYIGEQNFYNNSSKDIEILNTDFKNYITYRWGGTAVIILSPEKKLPIVAVSRKEVLDISEIGIKKALTDKKISENLHNEFIEALNKWREKYKNSLDEPAMIKNDQLNPYAFSSDWDLFQPSSASKKIVYTVYKFDPEIMKETIAGKVKWVTVTFPYQHENSNTAEKEVYRAMRTHLNLEYIYNYFFNPEKVKGIPYKPINEELLITNSKLFTKAN